MSDWGATHSTSINAGLDQEMPSANFMGDSLAAAVAAGNVSEATVGDSVTRILTALYAVGVMDEPWGTYSFTKLQGRFSVMLEHSMGSFKGQEK